MKIDDSIKIIAKSANIVFIGMILSKILGFLYRAIIARMGVSEYGVISLGLAITSFLITISLMGLDFGVLRYVSLYSEKNNHKKAEKAISTATLISGTLSIILAIIIFVYASYLADLFNNKDIEIVLKIMAFVLPFDVLRIIFFSALKSLKKAEYEVFGKSIIENI